MVVLSMNKGGNQAAGSYIPVLLLYGPGTEGITVFEIENHFFLVSSLPLPPISFVSFKLETIRVIG
jgi:hypothetical protein